MPCRIETTVTVEKGKEGSKQEEKCFPYAGCVGKVVVGKLTKACALSIGKTGEECTVKCEGYELKDGWICQ